MRAIDHNLGMKARCLSVGFLFKRTPIRIHPLVQHLLFDFAFARRVEDGARVLKVVRKSRKRQMPHVLEELRIAFALVPSAASRRIGAFDRHSRLAVDHIVVNLEFKGI